MTGLRGTRERIAKELERQLREGQTVDGEERRFLLRFRLRARGAASGVSDTVATTFRGILRQKHPGTEWSTSKDELDATDDAT